MRVCVCVHVRALMCVSVCVRARAQACMCVCVRLNVCNYVHVSVYYPSCLSVYESEISH